MPDANLEDDEMASEIAFGSGNVFADLGLDAPEERLAKADLASKISSVIESRGLTQSQAGDIVGLPQPKVSALMRGRLEYFSTDRLFRILNKIGVSVSMVLTDEADWRPGLTTVQDGDVEIAAWMEPSEEETAAVPTM